MNHPLETQSLSWMQKCLDLARQGVGRTHPNPMVGSVVLDREGQLAGEGFHSAYGEPHAEVMALRMAGERARGGTLVVNLEPCHHSGKTPPCTEAILAAGIQTVITSMIDPNPQVAGHGIQTLQSKGLTVLNGILEAESQKLNEAFTHFIQHQTPYVVLKMAMTLDGNIATRSGQSQWITGPDARQWVHQLRSVSDGILTTAETVLQDNCQLTVREAPLSGKPPVRIVLDRRLRLNPEQHRILNTTASSGPVWIFTRAGNDTHPLAQSLQAGGHRLFTVPEKGVGLDLEAVMTILGQERITQLMVESGGKLAGSLLQSQLIHKAWLLYGPRLLNDPAAQPAFSGPPCFSLSQACDVRILSHAMVGDTLLLETYLV